MSDDLTPLPPQGMPRATPAQARETSRALKWLSDNFAETGMQSQANRALRESKWWLAYAATLEGMAAGEATRLQRQSKWWLVYAASLEGNRDEDRA
jgi:hypothetical protein